MPANGSLRHGAAAAKGLARCHLSGAAFALLFLAVVLAMPEAALAGGRQPQQAKDTATGSVDGKFVTYGFEPNDPYFPKDAPPNYPGQWHLVNQHTAGLDIGVQGAWDRGLTGQGVVVGLVDDCLERTHEDLAPNYDANNSWDFGENDADPSPTHSTDRHGVSTAGLVGARGGNGIGVTGVAPQAGLAGLRIDFPNQIPQMFADAILYHSDGNDTSIMIKSHSYGIASDYVSTPLESNAVSVSASYGAIHCWAASNEGSDVNKKDLQNQAGAIPVAALGSDGTYADYSGYGAALFACAPSSSDYGFRITTTDRTGDAYGYNTTSEDPFPDSNYTSVFGGTSACAPQLAGVLALAMQAQPNLDSRFAKHLLVRTCKKVDPNDNDSYSDGGWRANAAGHEFNQNYGFGLIDADALTLMATQYTGVTPLETESTGTITVGEVILDNDANGIVRAFQLTSTTPLEDLLVTIDITHTYHSDINIEITSPSLTTSRLVKGHEGGRGESSHHVWEYCSNVFWGEDPNGTWTIRLADIWAADTGTWHSFEVTARMGELVPEPGTVVLLVAGAAFASRRRRRRMGRS